MSAGVKGIQRAAIPRPSTAVELLTYPTFTDPLDTTYQPTRYRGSTGLFSLVSSELVPTVGSGWKYLSIPGVPTLNGRMDVKQSYNGDAATLLMLRYLNDENFLALRQDAAQLSLVSHVNNVDSYPQVINAAAFGGPNALWLRFIVLGDTMKGWRFSADPENTTAAPAIQYQIAAAIPAIWTTRGKLGGPGLAGLGVYSGTSVNKYDSLKAGLPLSLAA